MNCGFEFVASGPAPVLFSRRARHLGARVPTAITVFCAWMFIAVSPRLWAEGGSYAGQWDASRFPFVNSHPTTFALRVEVCDADTGFPIPDCLTIIDGEWTDQVERVPHTLDLRARTDINGVAVFAMTWHDETRGGRLISVTDDIEKAQRIVARHQKYKQKTKLIDLSFLKREKDSWKDLLRQTPGSRFFVLKTPEEYKHGPKRSQDPFFFQCLFEQNYHKIYTPESLGGDYEIPPFHERLTIGPFVVLPIKFELNSLSSKIEVEVQDDLPPSRLKPKPRSNSHASINAPDTLLEKPSSDSSANDKNEPGSPDEAQINAEGTLIRSYGIRVAVFKDETFQRLGFYSPTSVVVVTEIAQNSPFAMAGIGPNSIFERMDNQKIESIEDLISALKKYRTGDQASVSFFLKSRKGGWQHSERILVVKKVLER